MLPKVSKPLEWHAADTVTWLVRIYHSCTVFARPCARTKEKTRFCYCKLPGSFLFFVGNPFNKRTSHYFLNHFQVLGKTISRCEIGWKINSNIRIHTYRWKSRDDGETLGSNHGVHIVGFQRSLGGKVKNGRWKFRKETKRWDPTGRCLEHESFGIDGLRGGKKKVFFIVCFSPVWKRKIYFLLFLFFQAHCRAFLVSKFYESVEKLNPSSEVKSVLRQLSELYALYWILEKLGDFLRVRKVWEKFWLDPFGKGGEEEEETTTQANFLFFCSFQLWKVLKSASYKNDWKTFWHKSGRTLSESLTVSTTATKF